MTISTPLRSDRAPTLALLLSFSALAPACIAEEYDPGPEARALELGLELEGDDGDHEDEPEGPEYFSAAALDVLPAIDCGEKQDTGYVKGDPFAITVVTIDGKPVELNTANAFYAMQQAASADGVGISIVSGFRTMAQQQKLYNCYINCNCNNCNLAAKPGYSNHQSGHALDLNTGVGSVKNWLENHADEWGFARTVPSESWHYEWWGGGPPHDGPCGKPLFAGAPSDQSFPTAEAPPILLEVGETRTGWFDLTNTGKATWSSTTMLATSPDEPSPLVDESWPAPTRAARVDAETPPGELGRFQLVLRGNEPGDVVQTFSLVNEGEDQISWFAEESLTLRVIVTEPAPPVPTTDTDTDTDTDEGTGDSSTSAGQTTGDSSTSDGDDDPDGDDDSDGDVPLDTSSTGTSGGSLDAEGGCACIISSTPGSPTGPGMLGILGLLGMLARPRRHR